MVAAKKLGVEEPLTLSLENVNVKQLREDCYRVKFVTSRGTNQAILHHRRGSKAATVLVGGAGEPKELVLFKGANHGIDEKRDEMKCLIEDFLIRHLMRE